MRHVDPRLMAGTGLRAPETKDTSTEQTLTEIKKTVDEVMTGFEEFKSANEDRLKQIEKKGSADPVTEEKLARIDKALDAGEELSKKFLALEQQQKSAKDDADKAEEALAKLEAKLNRPGAGSPEDRAEMRKKTVNDWSRAAASAITVGVPNLNEEQQKALAAVAAEHKSLNITNDTAGGYLAPIEFVREIIKGVTEITPARQLARMRATTFKTIEIPKRTGQFAAQRVSEQGARSETPGLAYGLEEMSLPEMYAVIDISQQMLEDSAFDMEEEIRMEANEQFSVKIGQEFISGTGVGQMEGILVNGDVGETVSGSATAVAADGILTLKHAIKTAYSRNATFLLNRTTLGSVRKLKDSNGQYLWMPGIAQGKPNSIDGDPYMEAADMPNEGAGTYPIAYGDFRRGYLIGERVAMTFMRDPYTQAASGNVRFWFRARNNGQVVLAEAIRKMKCST